MAEGEGVTLASLDDLDWDTDDSPVPPPLPKLTKRQPSMLFIKPEVDLRVPSHARYIADNDGEVRDVLSTLKRAVGRQLYPDDMPWGNPSLEVVKDTFAKILQSDFKPARTNVRKGRTEKAIEMPLRAAYYQCRRLYDDPTVHLVVLDVTMGKELLYMYQANNNQRLNCHVHLVMRGAGPKTMHRLNWWTGCTYEGKLHIHPFDELPTVGRDGNRLCVSRVFCDLSTGYWFATDVQKVKLFNWLDYHLETTGEFIGTYVNPDSVKHFEVKTRGQESGLGLVEFRDPTPEWNHGTVLVRVDQKVFEDGRIPYEFVSEECARRGFSMGTPGLKYMEKYGIWSVPSRHKMWVRSAEVSCVDLLYIRRPKLLFCDPFPIKTTWVPMPSELPAKGPYRGSWNFPQNHGKIIGPGDIYFFHPEDQLLAYKQHGTSGKLIITDTEARILISHRAGDTVHQCAVEFSGTVMAQVEVTTDGEGLIEQVWVLDVFDCPGITESDDFASRYMKGWELISKFRLPCVHKQDWVSYDPAVFKAMASTCGRGRGKREGVVFQSRRAPRGCFTNFLGSARYWKPRDALTVDKAMGKQVFEFYLDGTRVRERADKRIGNTPGQIAEIEAALSADEIVAVLDRTSHSPEVAATLVDAIESESLDVPPEVAIALLHPNKCRDTLYAELIYRGIVTSEIEASHVLARYSGIVEDLASEANLKLIRATSRLKWYDPESLSGYSPGEDMSLSELDVVEYDLLTYY